MKEQICMVTGANAGIGKQTALELARMGATVILVSRSRDRGEAARAEIIDKTGNSQVELLLADFSSPESIRNMTRAFQERYDRLNVLVNNAGIYLSKRQKTKDGLEMTFAVNHLGYFQTTLLLWESLLAGAPARVVNVSSDAHRSAKINFDDLQSRKRYSGFSVYSQSKLANLLFTYELNRRRNGSNITANAVHPGFVASNFGRNNGGVVGLFMKRIVPLIAKSVEDGAATQIYLASSPEVAGVSGRYFVDCKPVKSSPESNNLVSAARLWEISEELTGLHLPSLAIQNG